MSEILIDLRTKIVRSDTRVWRLFPGQGYAFLKRFIEQKKVFLDLPESILPPGVPSIQTPNLRIIVKRANAIVDYFAAQRAYLNSGEGTPPSRPPSSLDAYEKFPTYKRIGNGVSAIIAMFGEAQAGDLIVMPEPPGERKVLIGEFMTGPEDREVFALDEFYPSYKMTSRKVQWRARVDEPKLPRSLTEALRHQVPMSELSNEYILNILDFAYGSYIYGDNTKGARINIAAAEFNEQDNLDLSILIKLCSTIAWNWANNEGINGSLAHSL